MKEKLDHGDVSTLVKITGCEYKVSEERLNDVLSHWGVLSLKILEEVFHDPYDKEGYIFIKTLKYKHHSSPSIYSCLFIWDN